MTAAALAANSSCQFSAGQFGRIQPTTSYFHDAIDNSYRHASGDKKKPSTLVEDILYTSLQNPTT